MAVRFWLCVHTERSQRWWRRRDYHTFQFFFSQTLGWKTSQCEASAASGCWLLPLKPLCACGGFMAQRLFSPGTGREPSQSTAAHQYARMQTGAKWASAKCAWSAADWDWRPHLTAEQTAPLPKGVGIRLCVPCTIKKKNDNIITLNSCNVDCPFCFVVIFWKNQEHLWCLLQWPRGQLQIKHSLLVTGWSDSGSLSQSWTKPFVNIYWYT